MNAFQSIQLPRNLDVRTLRSAGARKIPNSRADVKYLIDSKVVSFNYGWAICPVLDRRGKRWVSAVVPALYYGRAKALLAGIKHHKLSWGNGALGVIKGRTKTALCAYFDRT